MAMPLWVVRSVEPAKRSCPVRVSFRVVLGQRWATELPPAGLTSRWLSASGLHARLLLAEQVIPWNCDLVSLCEPSTMWLLESLMIPPLLTLAFMGAFPIYAMLRLLEHMSHVRNDLALPLRWMQLENRRMSWLVQVLQCSRMFLLDVVNTACMLLGRGSDVSVLGPIMEATSCGADYATLLLVDLMIVVSTTAWVLLLPLQASLLNLMLPEHMKKVNIPLVRWLMMQSGLSQLHRGLAVLEVRLVVTAATGFYAMLPLASCCRMTEPGPGVLAVSLGCVL